VKLKKLLLDPSEHRCQVEQIQNMIHLATMKETATELFSIAEKYCSQEIKPVALHIISTFALINQRKAYEMTAKLHDLQK